MTALLRPVRHRSGTHCIEHRAPERAGTIRSPIAGRTVAICNALYCGAKSYTRLHRGRGWTHPHYMRMKD